MILMMHESGEVYVYMMRYFLGTNERTNKAILGVGCMMHIFLILIHVAMMHICMMHDAYIYT